MKKLALVVSAALGLVPHAAMAEIYVGGKAGYSMLQDSCLVESLCDEESVAGGIYVGANGNDYFGIELGYDWLGEFKTDMQTVLAPEKGDLTALTIAPKLRYPLGSASIYGKLGVARLEFEDLKDTSYLGALGIEYNLSDNFSTRLEYQRIQDAFRDQLDDANIDSVFLGMAYHFGASEAVAPVQPVPVEIETPAMPEPQPEPEPEKEKRIFKEYGMELFESNSAKLNSGSLTYFDWIVDTMKAFTQAQLTVIGHTDSTGATEYNQVLSEKRAKSVADYVSTQGIDASRIRVIGEGESNPKASNSTAAGRQENRRVEVIIDEFEYEVEK